MMTMGLAAPLTFLALAADAFVSLPLTGLIAMAALAAG